MRIVDKLAAVLGECQQRYHARIRSDEEKGREWALRNLDWAVRKLKSAASEGHESIDFGQPHHHASRLHALSDLLSRSGFRTHLTQSSHTYTLLRVSGWASHDKA